MGALDKCSDYIKTFRQFSDHPVLAFDTGDFLSAIVDLERSDYIIRAMRSAGYDAICVGDQEFLTGEEFFNSHFPTTLHLNQLYRERSEKYPNRVFDMCYTWRDFPEEWAKSPADVALSDNVSQGASQGFMFVERVSTHNYKGKQIYYEVFAVIDEGAFLFFPEEQSGWFRVSSSGEAIKSHANPRKLNILLSHSGLMRDKELAHDFPELDIIIGGHSQTVLEEPEVVGKTIIVHAGGFGRYVGRLDLRINADNDIEDSRYALVPMKQDMPSDKSVLAIIEEYEHEFFKDKKPRPHIKEYPDTLTIVSSEVCSNCHSEQYLQWETTAHAHAFKVIAERKKVYNPGCLSCHTTGFGHREGFVSHEITPQRKNIGCTECHFMPAGHIEDAKIAPLPVTETTCRRCHTSKNSPAFDFDDYSRDIRH